VAGVAEAVPDQEPPSIRCSPHNGAGIHLFFHLGVRFFQESPDSLSSVLEIHQLIRKMDRPA